MFNRNAPLTFSPRQVGAQNKTVRIIEDGLIEPTESFILSVELSPSFSDGNNPRLTNFVSPNTAEVVIFNTDSKNLC